MGFESNIKMRFHSDENGYIQIVQPSGEIMVITKEKIQKQIDSMPDQFDTEELMERIYIMSKIERGLQDIREGNVFTQDEVRASMAKWLR